MTITIDDAGIGDLLFGVVIGAFRDETQAFAYEVLEVKYFRDHRFRRKEYLKRASELVQRLLDRLKPRAGEPILICTSYLFDEAVKELETKYSENPVRRTKVTGEPQFLTETAYLDELRNLGYEPLRERDLKRAKSFFHMMNWLKRNPDKLRYAKSGWPRLSRYRLFKHQSKKHERRNHT